MPLFDRIARALRGHDAGPLSRLDLQTFWRVKSEIEDTARNRPIALPYVLAHHGVRDLVHWRAVEAALHARFANHPGYRFAAERAARERALSRHPKSVAATS
jgi:hypothetical protein